MAALAPFVALRDRITRALASKVGTTFSAAHGRCAEHTVVASAPSK